MANFGQALSALQAACEIKEKENNVNWKYETTDEMQEKLEDARNALRNIDNGEEFMPTFISQIENREPKNAIITLANIVDNLNRREGFSVDDEVKENIERIASEYARDIQK